MQDLNDNISRTGLFKATPPSSNINYRYHLGNCPCHICFGNRRVDRLNAIVNTALVSAVVAILVILMIVVVR